VTSCILIRPLQRRDGGYLGPADAQHLCAPPLCLPHRARTASSSSSSLMVSPCSSDHSLAPFAHFCLHCVPPAVCSIARGVCAFAAWLATLYCRCCYFSATTALQGLGFSSSSYARTLPRAHFIVARAARHLPPRWLKRGAVGFSALRPVIRWRAFVSRGSCARWRAYSAGWNASVWLRNGYHLHKPLSSERYLSSAMKLSWFWPRVGACAVPAFVVASSPSLKRPWVTACISPLMNGNVHYTPWFLSVYRDGSRSHPCCAQQRTRAAARHAATLTQRVRRSARA